MLSSIQSRLSIWFLEASMRLVGMPKEKRDRVVVCFADELQAHMDDLRRRIEELQKRR